MLVSTHALKNTTLSSSNCFQHTVMSVEKESGNIFPSGRYANPKNPVIVTVRALYIHAPPAMSLLFCTFFPTALTCIRPFCSCSTYSTCTGMAYCSVSSGMLYVLYAHLYCINVYVHVMLCTICSPCGMFSDLFMR